MKKILALILVLGLFASYVYAQTAPALEEANRIHFTDVHQTTNTRFLVKSIVWASASGDEVSGTGGFLLLDRNRNFVAGAEATAISDNLVITIPDGILVDGFYADVLEGDVTVYGKRK